MASDMKMTRYLNIKGVNIYTNPLLKQEGDLIRGVNVDSNPYGAKSKRPGYITYLGTAEGSAPTTLFTWYKNDGSTFYNYRASGSSLYYSIQGTGAWTLAGNGTIGAGAHVGHAVLDNTLFICDGVGSTRHTTNGTAFTDTTLAPVAVDLEMYQNRIYAAGTSSTLFYSTANDGTNWSTSGTSDSSSFSVPGAGKLSKLIKSADRLVATKNSGLMYKWDGYALVDTSSEIGPSSPYSVAETEGYNFWINRLGHFGYGGAKPQLLSNAVQGYFYNNSGSGVAGATFDTLPAECHKYNYYAAIGTVTDDFTNETIDDAVLKYDYQKNEYLTYSFNDFPTAFNSYKDANGDEQLIWGASGGQCYKLSGTAVSDNGTEIEAEMEFIVDMDHPELDKEWKWLYAFFNPGCQAQVSVAWSDTYRKTGKRYQPVGDAQSGVLRERLPSDARSKFLFVKIHEASKDPAFVFYGFSVEGKVIPE